MDNMSITDVLLVSIPEISLNIIIGLILCNGNIFKDRKIKHFLSKLVFSVVFVASLLLIVRSVANNLIVITSIGFLIYALTFKLFWNYNFRQSVFSGNIVQFMIVVFDIASFPIVGLLNDYLNIDASLFFKNRLIYSSIPRFLQITTLIITLKFNLNMSKNKLIHKSWNELDRFNKLSSILLNLLILFSFIFNMNYADIFVKLKMLSIDDKILSVNMGIYFVETIICLSLTIAILYRSVDYRNYKKVIANTSEEFIECLISSTSNMEKLTYAKKFLDSVELTNFDGVNKYFKNLLTQNPNIKYKLDNRLSILHINYSLHLKFIDYIVSNIIKDKECLISLTRTKKNVITKIDIASNDILLIRQLKSINSDSTYTNLRSQIWNKYYGKINIKYTLNNNIYIYINIPILEGGAKHEKKIY